jgi:hypothetical protein
MYFLKPEHTYWIFNCMDWFNDLVRIEMIMVDDNSVYYQSAVESSIIHETDENGGYDYSN